MATQAWFEAARTGDCQYISDNKQYFQGYLDKKFPKATALIYAVENKQANAAKLLIAAERRKQNQFGWCALHCAVYSGYTALVKLLMNYESNIVTRQAWRDVPAGASALYIAMQLRRDEIVYILAEGTDLNAFYGKYELNGQDYIGRTSLHYLALSSNIYMTQSELFSMARELTKYTDKLGKTATMLAAECGNDYFLKMLGEDNIELGMQIDCSENEAQRGCTALMLAANAGHLACAYFLYKHEAKMGNFNGYSAMMYAAKKGNVEIVKLLKSMESGMQTTRTLGYIVAGTTALILAQLNDQHAVVSILLDTERDICNSLNHSYLTCYKPGMKLRESVGEFENVQRSSGAFALSQNPFTSPRTDEEPTFYAQTSSYRVSYIGNSPFTSYLNNQQTQCTECQALREQNQSLRKRCMSMSYQLERSINDDEYIGIVSELNSVISKLALFLNRFVTDEANPVQAVYILDKMVSDMKNDYQLISPKDLEEIRRESKASKQDLWTKEMTVKKLETEKQEVDYENEALKKEIKHLYDSNSELASKMEKLEQRYSEFEIESQRIQDEMKQIKKMLDIYPDDDIVDRLEGLIKETAALKKQQEEHEAQRKQKEKEYVEEIEKLKKEKTKTEGERREFEEQSKKHQQQVQSQELEIAYLNKSVEMFKGEVSKSNEQKAKLTSQVSSLKSVLANKQAIINEFAEKLGVPYSDNVSQDLEQYIKTAKEDHEQREELQRENYKLNQKILDKDNRINQLDSQVTELKNRVYISQTTTQKMMQQFMYMQAALKEQQANLLSIFEEGQK